MKTKLTTFQKIALTIAGLLTLFGIVETALHLGTSAPLSRTIFVCLNYVAIIYYALYGFKIPHGNTLKYIILLFALSLVDAIALESSGRFVDLVPQTTLISATLTGLCVLIISYVAGRLDRFYKNMTLCTIVLLFLFFRAFSMTHYKTIMFVDLADIIIWIDIMCVYAIRFNQHREVGLQTK